MKITKVEYAALEGDPALIVTYENGAIDCFEKNTKGWVINPEVMAKAKLRSKADFDRAFPDAGFPTDVL